MLFPYFFQCRCIGGHHPSKNSTCDLIGPPDPLSNLRPIKLAIRPNETKLEKEMRFKREELQAWNERFWTKHNAEFLKQKEEYTKNWLKMKKSQEQTVSADEMSVFYKKFLDDNWSRHLVYNFTWYRKNCAITFLDFKVKFRRLIKYLYGIQVYQE